MKKSLLVLLLVSTMSAFSQNVQLHYDMLEGREQLTTTVEMFKPDSWGNTFFFIDMNYGVKALNDKNARGVNLAYWEIARVFKHNALPVGFHAEFDGGLGRFSTPNGDGGFRINEAYLTGIDYSWNTTDFSKGFSLKALYKYIAGIDKPNNFQLTGVWYAHFLKGKVTFNGFVDFWRQGDAEKDKFKVYPTIAIKYSL